MKSIVRHGFCDCISLRRKILQWHLRCNNDKSNLSLMSRVLTTSMHRQCTLKSASSTIDPHGGACVPLIVHFNFSKTNDFPVAARKGPTTSVVGIGCSKSFERQVQLALAVRQRSSYTLCRAATPTTNIQFLSGNKHAREP